MGGQAAGEQKAQLDAYLKEVDMYAKANKNAYKQLTENLDALGPDFFDRLIGRLAEETPNLAAIKNDHSEYKGLFTKGKKSIQDGGELDRLFEEYKSVVKGDKKTPQEAESAFKKMDKAYVSLINGILMIYNPRILGIYQQIAESVKEYTEKSQRIKNLITILQRDYKADKLIERIMEEQARQKAA